jgi:hypothetical protein
MAMWLIERYYWDFYSTLYEYLDIINTDNVFLSSPDIAVYEGIIKARLEFIDGTILIVEMLLQVTVDYEIYEERYYYGYYEADRRIFAYDNRPHHVHISTFPHHKHTGQVSDEDTVYPADIRPVNLANVLAKIREYLNHVS